MANGSIPLHRVPEKDSGSGLHRTPVVAATSPRTRRSHFFALRLLAAGRKMHRLGPERGSGNAERVSAEKGEGQCKAGCGC